jgi:hypothetical protein
VEKTYRLKPIVAARLLSEVSALVVLVCLPLFLLVHGDFFRISLASQALSVAVATAALLIMPAYGFVTYKVEVDEEGLKTFSLFKKQFARWQNINKLKLKTSWGFRRYVLDCQDEADISFPIWLHDVHGLCELIRARLPNRGASAEFAIEGGSTGKLFEQAGSATVIQFTRASANLMFIVLCWMFFVWLQSHSAATSEGDRLFMLVAFILLSLFLLLRSAFLLMMPRRIITDDEGVEFTGHFYQRRMLWGSIHSVAPSFFLLPEGLLITTDQGFYLIGDQLDAFDELQDELVKRLPPPAVPDSPAALKRRGQG